LGVETEYYVMTDQIIYLYFVQFMFHMLKQIMRLIQNHIF